MVEQYFRAVHVRARLHAGGLGEYADEVIAYLDRRGHRVSTVHTYVQAMEHFARWVRQRGETLGAVDSVTVTRFLTGHLPRCHCPTPAPCRRRGMRAPLRHLLTVLGVPALARTRAVVPPPAMAPVLADYAAHLHATCGLAPATCRYRLRYAREFLGAHFGRGRVDATALTARDIRAFVTARATPSTPGTAQVIASSVRSLLRFLQLRGEVSPALVHAVPSVARWRHAHLPRALTADELRRL